MGELQPLLIPEVNQKLVEVQLEDGEFSVYCTVSPEHESALQVGGTGNPQEQSTTTCMVNRRIKERVRFANKAQLPEAWNKLCLSDHPSQTKPPS